MKKEDTSETVQNKKLVEKHFLQADELTLSFMKISSKAFSDRCDRLCH